MARHKIKLQDKELFTRVFSLSQHELSAYAFANIYIWKGIFDISWEVIEGNLCIFFQDRSGVFLYLPPQGARIRPQVISKCFRIMDAVNANPEVSRIENVQARELDLYQGLGYLCREKFPEYLCQRDELIQLKGNRFKSKRACLNYFLKNYAFEYLDFFPRQKKGCLKLYDCWKAGRKARNPDPVYQGMLDDSRKSLEILLDDYPRLGIFGKVVKVQEEIKAFTFGFELSPRTFCVLFEVADLAIKGLSQFIFREFCREMVRYKYINIMDDSGLENLKEVKLSYHPVKLIPAYTVTRKNE